MASNRLDLAAAIERAEQEVADRQRAMQRLGQNLWAACQHAQERLDAAIAAHPDVAHLAEALRQLQQSTQRELNEAQAHLAEEESWLRRLRLEQQRASESEADLDSADTPVEAVPG